jgi:integrase
VGDIDDRWYRQARDPETGARLFDPGTGKPILEASTKHGRGLRYAARWRDDNRQQRTKLFDTMRDARAWLVQVEGDLARGAYVDHKAGKIRLREHAERYLENQTTDPASQHQLRLRFRVHILPALGARELRSLKPSVVQAWVAGLDMAPSYARVIVANLSSCLQAAVDDGLIATNPCRSASVRAPSLERRRVIPWPAARIAGVRQALPDRYREIVTTGAGLGLRQGEIFGLAVEDVDFLRGVVHVRRQVKPLDNRLVFALPKRAKERSVPLPQSVALRLAAHLQAFPATEVELPWRVPDGKPTGARLLFTRPTGKALDRKVFSRYQWAAALAKAGAPGGRENGCHALRHYFASVVLGGGASIRDLADWLGHEDPGFTLRTYVHLLPASETRMRDAIDQAFTDAPAALAVAGLCARCAPEAPALPRSTLRDERRYRS